MSKFLTQPHVQFPLPQTVAFPKAVIEAEDSRTGLQPDSETVPGGIQRLLTERSVQRPFIIDEVAGIDENGDMTTASSTIASIPFTQVCLKVSITKSKSLNEKPMAFMITGT